MFPFTDETAPGRAFVHLNQNYVPERRCIKAGAFRIHECTTRHAQRLQPIVCHAATDGAPFAFTMNSM